MLRDRLQLLQYPRTPPQLQRTQVLRRTIPAKSLFLPQSAQTPTWMPISEKRSRYPTMSRSFFDMPLSSLSAAPKQLSSLDLLYAGLTLRRECRHHLRSSESMAHAHSIFHDMVLRVATCPDSFSPSSNPYPLQSPYNALSLYLLRFLSPSQTRLEAVVRVRKIEGARSHGRCHDCLSLISFDFNTCWERSRGDRSQIENICVPAHYISTADCNLSIIQSAATT